MYPHKGILRGIWGPGLGCPEWERFKYQEERQDVFSPGKILRRGRRNRTPERETPVNARTHLHTLLGPLVLDPSPEICFSVQGTRIFQSLINHPTLDIAAATDSDGAERNLAWAGEGLPLHRGTRPAVGSKEDGAAGRHDRRSPHLSTS